MQQRQHVLAIDDDPAICRLLKARLENEHVEVVCAADGREARANLNSAIDLILLDVHLPDTDGFALCAEIRQKDEFADVPIIFLTGSDAVEDKVRAFDAGGTDYVVKPFNDAVLRARVGAALRMQRLLHERREAEAALREREQAARKLAMIVRRTDYAVVMTDAEARVEWVNAGFTRLAGYAPHEVLGESLISVLLGPGTDLQTRRELRDYIELREGFSGEVANYRKDGTQYWAGIDVQPVHDEHGRLMHFIALARDVTSRVKAEQDRIRLLNQLSERMKELTALHKTARLLDESESDEENVLQRVVDLLPQSFRFPWSTAARIIYEGYSYATRRFVESPHKLTSCFQSTNGREGIIEVVYRGTWSSPDEPIFFPEEQQMIDSIADMLKAWLDRAAAIKAMREQRALLHSVIEHIPMAVFWKDRDLRYMGCNQVYADQIGVADPEAIIGRTDDELLSSGTIRSILARSDREVVAAGEPLLNVEQTWRNSGGETRTVLMNSVPLRDADHRTIGVLGICADITQRKQVEDAVRASEHKLHAITAQLPAIVWTTDRHLDISSMHGAILAEFELDAATLIGKPVSMIFTRITKDSCASIVEAHRKAMQGDSVHERFAVGERCTADPAATMSHEVPDLDCLETAVATEIGAGDCSPLMQCEPDSESAKEFEVRVEPLLDNSGECIGCLGLAFDITERKRIEQVERHQIVLQEAVEAMEQVLGVIGHELRTPLTGLRVMSELLLNDDQPQAGDQESQFIHTIHDEVIRLAGMVNDLLEAARLNSGKARWNWSMFDLGEVCRAALDVTRHCAEAGDVEFGCDIAPESLLVRGDRDAMQRLLINLLANAEKHTTCGVIEIKVREDNREDGRWVSIEVRDTGEGMTREVLEKLGVPFALNAGVIGSSAVKGSGLGMAICKGIVVAHGGTIKVNSRRGEGTCVIIDMPADLPGPVSDVRNPLLLSEVAQ